LGGLFFILASVVVLYACRNAQTNDDQQSLSASVIASEDTTELVAMDTIWPGEEDTLISIIGVGDMMLGTNYPSASYLPPNGGTGMLADLEEVLIDADITFGNLEGVILDKGGTPKRCGNPNACYVFRSPTSYGQHFKKAGFDLLSIANNHSGDFGPEGRRITKKVLDELEIAYAGLAGTDEMAIIERAGLKIGFCAFAPNRGTCDIRNITRAKEIVTQLEKQTDMVIVSFHGGAEGASHQNVPRRTETYYGENRGNVHAFAHGVIDAGADIVFGHGPHVTRAAEVYKDRFIIYSLGNFCTYGRFNLRGAAGIAPLIKLNVTKTGEFVDGKVIPIYQQKTHGPKIDPQNRAITKLKELTAQDFPKTSLKIDADGSLSVQ
ncbi:MAG: CapA family protein, partial [Bacteroidota bacterium]